MTKLKLTREDVERIVAEARERGEVPDLSDCDLSYLYLEFIDLRRADLHDTNLHRADLGGADLRYANLHDANLRCARLSYADLSDADLSDASLRYADLDHANLTGATVGLPLGMSKLHKDLSIRVGENDIVLVAGYWHGTVNEFIDHINVTKSGQAREASLLRAASLVIMHDAEQAKRLLDALNEKESE